MLSLAADQLRRLQHLLATAKDEYDKLDFIMLEGPVQVTYHSLQRSVTVPIGGDDVGHINTMLAEAVLQRIETLEKQIVEAHNQVVVASDEQALDEDQLAGYRQRPRSVGGSAEPIASAQSLVASTSTDTDEHSP
jgi:hypothetical protein